MAESVTIAGAGLAGLRAAEALRLNGFGGTITLIGAERRPPYDRPPLSKQVLAGTWPADRALLPQDPELDARWLVGRCTVGLDTDRRRLRLDDGREEAFGGLIIATGATARALPGLGPVPGVFTLRTLDDCTALADALGGATRLVVVGAGFIGSEVASTARSLGLRVTVVEAAPAPLTRVLGPAVGPALGLLHARHGVDLRCSTTVTGVDVGPDGRARNVRLGDGSSIPADVVVVGVGARPNVEWLAGSDIAVDDGVRCDQWCRALDRRGRAIPGIVAAGDVARWPHSLFGRQVRLEHWTNAVEQAEYAARTLLTGGDGPPAEPFAPVPYVWSDQYGSKISFLGLAEPGDEVRVLAGSLDRDKFLAVYGRDGVVTAAVGLDMPAQVMAWEAKIAVRAPFPP